MNWKYSANIWTTICEPALFNSIEIKLDALEWMPPFREHWHFYISWTLNPEESRLHKCLHMGLTPHSKMCKKIWFGTRLRRSLHCWSLRRWWVVQAPPEGDHCSHKPDKTCPPWPPQQHSAKLWKGQKLTRKTFRLMWRCDNKIHFQNTTSSQASKLR